MDKKIFNDDELYSEETSEDEDLYAEKISLEKETRPKTFHNKNFVAAYGVDRLKKIPSAAIGSITSQTLQSFGVTAAVVAKEFTIGGLVEAIKKFYGGTNNETN